MNDQYEQARKQMIDGQIHPFSVTDPDVLSAFAQLPREKFVPGENKAQAYMSEDVPLGKGRWLLEPAVHARLIQEALSYYRRLDGTGKDEKPRVLEIATASGYGIHIWDTLVKEVVGIDKQEWIDLAQSLLKAKHAKLSPDDLSEPGSSLGTFDIVFINGAIEDVPEELAGLLKDSGVVATIYRPSKAESYAALFVKQEGGSNFVVEPLFDAYTPVLNEFKKEQEFVF